MQVLLIPHAAGARGGLDSHARGCARALGERLRWYDCAPVRVWATPAGIATAEVIAAVLTLPPPIEAVDWLGPADSAAACARVRATAVGPGDMIAICAGGAVLARIGAELTGAPLSTLPPLVAARIVDGRLRWRFGWDAEAAEPA